MKERDRTNEIKCEKKSGHEQKEATKVPNL